MGTISELSYPLDLVRLDPGLGEPIHRQLCGQLRELILGGAVAADTRLPSIRAMAAELGISRNTVIAALDQLSAEGLIEARRGAGTRVAPEIVLGPKDATPDDGGGADLSRRGRLMSAQPRFGAIPGRTSFHPGLPDISQFPFKTWSRLLMRRARYGGEDLFGYHYILGHPHLRSAIAGFLQTMRRVRCTPGQIVVTTGGQAALDLLARVLLDEGDTVWMEEPGYLGARGAFLAAGARLAPLGVDRGGWSVDAAPAAGPALVYVTPSCQHPLGLTMPLRQRLDLLEVARQRGAWVIEDDFDGEYTFRGHPQPAMQGLTDHRKVIYVGTFAKVLFPAMRLGFMVVPEDIAEKMRVLLSLTGQFAPLLLQAALADFIEQGYFFRHLNRMRRLYGRRRAAFTERFRDDLSGWLELYDGWSGIQIAAAFRHPADEGAVVDRCRAAGMNPSPLSIYYAGNAAVPGLLMGYAAVSGARMEQGLGTLRRILEAQAPPPPGTGHSGRQETPPPRRPT